MIDLSIITVSWNTRDLLARCLSTVQQGLDEFDGRHEVIVVDNASSDGSAAMVEARFPESRLIAQPENWGFASASNIGMNYAQGRVLLLLNPDTELLPGALAGLWRALHAAPHVGLVGPLLLNPDGTTQSAGYRFPGLVQSALDLLPVPARVTASRFNGRIGRGDGLSPIAIDHPLGACMMVKREVVVQVGGFDEGFFMYSEEIDWCRRIKDAGWTILLAPAAKVIHHGGQSTQQVPAEMFRQLHRSRARYLRRYHPAWVARAVGHTARLAAAIERRPGSPDEARTRAKALLDVSHVYVNRESRPSDA